MTTLVVVAVAAGYLLGRLRPFHALREHVWLKVFWGGIHGAARQNVYAVAFIALFPIRFVKGWIAVERRRRNPPPPPRQITLSPDFLARMRGEHRQERL